jgi:plasmid stabilization system protein ParE
MRVVLAKRALGDLTNAIYFIAQDDPVAAERMAARIRGAAALLAEFPNLGQPISDHGRRVFSVTGTPFRLIYRVAADRLTVLRIWHGARG